MKYIKHSEDDDKLLDAFNEFKSEMKTMFSDVPADKTIITRIRESLITEKTKKLKSDKKQLTGKQKKKLKIEEKIEKDREREIVQTDLSKEFKIHLWESGINEFINKIKTALLYLVIPLILTGIVFYVVDINKYNTPWSIEELKGQTIINNNHIKNKFSEGNIAETKNDSEARITVPDCGDFLLSENTSLELIRGYYQANVVRLNSGKINFVSNK